MNNGQCNRTENIRRSLIALIVENDLKSGDKLPSQAELRGKLNVGSATIRRAIQTFVEDGILEVKPNCGVYLANENLLGRTGRNIGTVNFRIFNYPAGVSLQHCLRVSLVDNACREIPFIRNTPEGGMQDSLAMYDGLCQAIEKGTIDGIISTVSFDGQSRKKFEEYGVHVCSLGTAAYPYGAVVRNKDSYPRALRLAYERGFEKVAVIGFDWPAPGKLQEIYSSYFPHRFENYCRLLNMSSESASQELLYKKITEVIDELWQRPEEKRPDCMIILDDIITATAYMYLRYKTNQIPHFIYEICEQLPFFMPPEVIGDYFFIDHKSYVSTAVNLLIDVINGRQPADACIELDLKLITKEEQLKK